MAKNGLRAGTQAHMIATLHSRPDQRAMSTPTTVGVSTADATLRWYLLGLWGISTTEYRYSEYSLMIATTHALRAVNRTMYLQVGLGNLHAAASEHSHQNKLRFPRNLQALQKRHWRDQKQNVVDYVDTGKRVPQVPTVEARPFNGVVPVFLHWPASKYRHEYADQSKDDVEDGEAEEDAPGGRRDEDA